jgi:hypothetical protein
MAAIQPPVPGIAATAPITTFVERYRDNRFDSENGSYSHLLREFDPMTINARTAVQLYQGLLQEPDDTARAMLVHWQDPNTPADPGKIAVLHGIKRFPQSLGSPATQWDNRDFCWYQDMVDTAPPTIFEFASAGLEIAEPTPGVLNLRVYDAPTLEAMYAANPAMVIGPVPLFRNPATP